MKFAIRLPYERESKIRFPTLRVEANELRGEEPFKVESRWHVWVGGRAQPGVQAARHVLESGGLLEMRH